MAIYKPSNCVPFLSNLDLTQPHDISCELNTSNEVVTGYKIKLLDNNNDIIFEGKTFDSINIIGYDNTGLNGSTLTLPLIVEGDAVNNNTIGYKNGVFNVKAGNEFDSSKFFNGYIGQPYKWVITLEQGNVNGVKADKYYDMTITQGKVLGSTRNRIQSVLSEEIYKDYFIKLNNVENRVLINSYDHTYGYLYPQENKFTDAQIASANYFEIFKFSNDPDVIAAGSQVLFKTTTSMNDVTISGVKNSVGWGDELVYPNYFKQVFSGLSSSQKDTIPCSAFDSNMNGYLGAGTVIMVSNEMFTTYNGIFKLNGITETGNAESGYTLTLTWLRSTPGDTWANLTNAVFYVQNGTSKGTRWQVLTSKDTVGTINQTPVIFTPEQPIEIYTDASQGYGNSKTRGRIFKNSIDTVYIRPFIGIENGMRFSYLRENGTTYTNIDNIKIDTTYWSISGNIGRVLTPDKDQYKISTYFKTGDENPFYAYATPTVQIEYNGEVVASEFPDMTIIDRRIAKFQGVYAQENNKTWINYQWFLNDLTNGSSEQSDKFYSGDLSYTFFGLQDGHIYQIIFVVEDEFGVIYRRYGNINIDIDLLPAIADVTVEKDCLTQSYIVNFNKIGVVIPDPEIMITQYRVQDGSSEVMNDYTVKNKLPQVYQNYIVQSDVEDVGYNISYPVSVSGKQYLSLSDIVDVTKFGEREALMMYDKVRVTGEEYIVPIPAPTQNECTFNSQHQLNPNFQGDIITYEMEVDDYLFGTADVLVKVSLPPITVKNEKGEIELYENTSWTAYKQYATIATSLTTDDYNVARGVNERADYYVRGSSDIMDRYSIAATYLKRYPNGGEVLFSTKVIDWNKERAETAKVVSAWVKPGTAPAPNCDYIDTDLVYDATPLSGNYRHIRGEGIINSDGQIGYVIMRKEGQAPSFLEDKATTVVTQADGTKINVLTGNYNYWQDYPTDSNGRQLLDESGNPIWNYWFDNGSESPLYYQTDINKNETHTGRQYLHDKKMTLNLCLKNYNDMSYRGDFSNQDDNFVFNLFLEDTDK